MQVGKMQTQLQFNKNCESLFLLKRSDNSSTCGSVQVNFSPVQSAQADNNSLDVQKEVLKSFPIFNTDTRFYTPCFILEVDKPRYAENQTIYYSLHQKKIQELYEEKSTIFVPRPSKNCSFCCICKTVVDDYLTHVINPQHKAALLKSQFTSEIVNLCRKYGQKTLNIPEQVKTRGKIKKLKTIKKTTQNKKQKAQKLQKGSKL